MSLKREMEREKKLASRTARRHYILRMLYLSDGYILTDLRKKLEELEEKTIDTGNLSRYIGKLEKDGLIIKEDRKIKLSSSGQEIVYAIMEAARPEEEKPWWPQQEEVELCLEILNTAKTKEVFSGFINELVAILYSGYWDKKLEDFFNEKLNDPEHYWSEISVLLRSQPRDSKGVETFIKSKKDEIYALIGKPNLSSLALRAFLNISSREEAKEKIKESLDGEGAVIFLRVAKGHGRELYEKLGPELKAFLRDAMEQGSESVRSRALELMYEITSAKGPEISSKGRYVITEDIP